MKIIALKQRLRQHGLTTLEYCIAGGLIAVVVVAALTLLGGNTGNVLNNVASNIN